MSERSQDVEASFQQLREYLLRFNALDFLSQFSMTYLFTPENQFVGEADEIHRDFRALELASGLYGTVPLLESGERVDGAILAAYLELARSYYQALDVYLLKNATHGGQAESSSSMTSAKLHSLHVRGDAYPHQFWDLAEAVYGPHAAWLRANLGFTISEAISIAKVIDIELIDRYAEAKRTARENAPTLVQEQERVWKQAGLTEAQALTSAGVQLFFGRSKELYRLRIDDVVAKVDLRRETCEAFFGRLSQHPPFRNVLFPDTFTNPLASAWDYNATKERPFFTDGRDFWVFAPHILKEVLYSTFFFDLMNDAAYKGAFENSRGQVLESLTKAFLERAFPAGSVFLNPSYPNGEEFADVCVLFDGKILIVQCKSKGLTLGAHTGEDKAALKRDLEKAIGNAAAQGSRGKRFLRDTASPHLFVDGRRIDIDVTSVDDILLIAITYMPLHMFATRLREVEDDLGLPRHEFPVWALPIVDLDIVTQICSSPAKLLHYIRRRMMLEVGDKQIRGDEADLLAFYLQQGLWLRGGEIDEVNLIGISGYSAPIDEYVFQKFERNLEVSTPQVTRPPGFDDIIADIESLSTERRTDCALSLLDLSWKASEDLIGLVQRTKGRCRARKETIPSSMGHDDPPWGMSIVAVPSGIAEEEAFNRAQGFGHAKKYARRLQRWTALGWREGSARTIDYAFWLDFPFEHDGAMDTLTKRVFQED